MCACVGSWITSKFRLIFVVSCAYIPDLLAKVSVCVHVDVFMLVVDHIKGLGKYLLWPCACILKFAHFSMCVFILTHSNRTVT